MFVLRLKPINWVLTVMNTSSILEFSRNSKFAVDAFPKTNKTRRQHQGCHDNPKNEWSHYSRGGVTIFMNSNISKIMFYNCFENVKYGQICWRLEVLYGVCHVDTWVVVWCHLSGNFSQQRSNVSDSHSNGNKSTSRSLCLSITWERSRKRRPLQSPDTLVLYSIFTV